MKNVVRAFLVVLLAVGFAGCPQLQELQTENSQLKAKLANLDKSVGDMESQNELLRADNEKLKSQMGPGAGARAPKAPGESNAGLEKDLGPDVSVRTHDGKTILELPNKVFFASGSAKLSSKGQKALGRVADVLKKRFPDKMFYIEGYTDNEPISKSKDKFASNWELSCDRALTVLHFLIEREGVNPRHVAAVGYGEYQPLAPNTSAENKSKNRRVEILISPKL